MKVKGVFRDGAFIFVQSSNLKETAVPSIFDFSLYSAGATDAFCKKPLVKRDTETDQLNVPGRKLGRYRIN